MDIALSPATCWLLGGALLIALEMIGLSGIGMVFAGLAALSVGLAVQLAWLGNDSIIWQLTWFLLLTAIWAAILWRPFKKLTHKPKNESYQNIIGGRATAITAMERGKEGRARWSGTDWRARLDDSQSDSLPDTVSVAEGDELLITAIDGNCLIVKPTSK